MTIATRNPATGDLVKTFDAHSADHVDAGIARAHQAFQQWSRTSFADRAALMNRAADLLEQDIDVIAKVMTLEMGKTLKSARAEAAKCVKGMRFYAEHAEGFLADEPVEPSVVGASKAYGHYSPLGVILAVMPGTSRSGRSCGSQRPRLWRATWACSSTLRTCRNARCSSRKCSVGPDSPPECLRRCSSSPATSNACCGTRGCGLRR